MVALNLQGLLYIAHAALPHLLKAAADAPRQVADLVNISSTAGRVVRNGSGVYNLTKFGVVAFSESLRQEVASRHVRVAAVEPGAVATELASHLRDEVRATMMQRFANIERLQAAEHRRCHRLHRDAPPPRRRQRDADPPYRARELMDAVGGMASPPDPLSYPQMERGELTVLFPSPSADGENLRRPTGGKDAARNASEPCERSIFIATHRERSRRFGVRGEATPSPRAYFLRLHGH